MDRMNSLNSPGLEATIALVQELHPGLDTVGVPYWRHPVVVMESLPEEAGLDERLAALLHDVIEDTKETEETLRDRGYSERTISLVAGLSRNRTPPGTTYMDWIRRIAASGDISLIRIKLADNLHNADPERIAAIPDDETRRIAEERAANRYARSIRILNGALNTMPGAGALPRP